MARRRLIATSRHVIDNPRLFLWAQRLATVEPVLVQVAVLKPVRCDFCWLLHVLA